MQHVKYLILGAGPAGLAFANKLKEYGEDSFLVLEKEQEAGGLCRSMVVDGSPFDIGGGHFLDVRRPKVNAFLFQFMPQEEWNLFERDSRIDFNGKMINHPFEANIWQMNLRNQLKYLISISKAGCNKKQPMPEKFVDWIEWKLGKRVANDYMLPYNRKMFADELNELGTYWLEKLPNVSFKETLLSSIMHKPYGTQPGHASFYYPKKFGYGELWLRMAKALGSRIRYGAVVEQLDCEQRQIRTTDGEVYEADRIITTIPWAEYHHLEGMPQEIKESLRKLKHSSIETRYVPEMLETKAQWIYVPKESKPYHRILVRHNFCENAKGYWLETRKERVALFDKEAPFQYMNQYAYPLNTVEKPQMMKKLKSFCEEKKIYPLGRWGEHEHYNSDTTVELAIKLVERLYNE